MGYRKNIWYVIGSLLCSAAIFAYLFSIVGPRQILSVIRQVYLPGIAVYMAAAMCSTVFRNMRYLLLLRATSAETSLTSGQMFLVTLVRNLFADLLPARVGSLIYVVVLKARFGCPVEIGASVWAVAFVLDLVVMVPLMTVGIWVVGAARLGVSMGVLFGVSLTFSLLTVALLTKLPRMLSWYGNFLRGSVVGKFGNILREAAGQIEIIYHRGVFVRAMALSFLVRIFKYGAIVFMVFAILHPVDPEKYTLHSIGFWPVLTGSSLSELSASTPLSGISGFGPYEGVWGACFYLLGYPRDLAIITGISAHLLGQIFGVSLGLAAIIILMFPVLGKRGKK